MLLPPLPLKSVTPTFWRMLPPAAEPIAKPVPIFEPFGQAFVPLSAIFVGSHDGNRLPLKFAPHGNWICAFWSTGGSPPSSPANPSAIESVAGTGRLGNARRTGVRWLSIVTLV